MKPLWIALAAWAVSAPALFARQAAPPAPQGETQQEQLSKFDELDRAYGRAVKAWRDERRAAAKESKEKEAQVAARHPIKETWPRFEALAAEGEGRALVWLVDEAGDYFESSEAARAKKSELVARLVAQHADQPWAADVMVRMLTRQRSWFDETWVRTKLEELAKASKNAEVCAAAYCELAQRLSSSKASAADKQRATELQAKVTKEYAETAAGRELISKNSASSYEVGGTPPDFEATDPDGTKFKLSDYRGKVVMLDFWGFW
ncbi:MAG: redoxin domain-containing protein [Planctomycetes bacterium]|nr:redoxin domain-containing protein [Planctomycetota bacterium]